MNRAEHLAWCKQRALECVDAGDCKGALASMLSDLGKHEDTKDHAAIRITMMLMLGGHLTIASEVRRHIEGFN